MKIILEHVNPPIALRDHDWRAYDAHSFDEGIYAFEAWGATPEQALTDLFQQMLDLSASTDMLDALRQWRWAEQNNDATELANARISRDAAIKRAEGRS